MQLRLSGAAGLLLLLLAVLTCTPAQAQDPVEGDWLTQDHEGVIAIDACGASICGRIVGMNAPHRPDGSLALDHAGHPICGLSILRADPAGAGTWQGHIIDPDTGTSWTCRLTLAADGTLHLRGYVLTPLLGRTQVWTRSAAPTGADCAMS